MTLVAVHVDLDALVRGQPALQNSKKYPSCHCVGYEVARGSGRGESGGGVVVEGREWGSISQQRCFGPFLNKIT